VNSYCNRWREDESLGVRVAAGWDHDPERAAKASESHGVEMCDSPHALLKRPDVEAVVIAAETSRHADLSEAAAEAGKAVILQKPMALTLPEADRIIAAVDRSGVPFTMAWQMRADPQNLRMKELIESGAVGRVLMVRRRHCLSTHLWAAFEDSWHVDPAANRDIWADDAAHAVDFIYWLLGMPASVTAELGTLVNPKVPNDNGVAVYRYADGTFAEVSCSFACVAGENTTEVIGDRGTIIQNYGDAPSANVPRPEGAVGLKWYLQETREWTDSGIPSPASHGERIAGLARPLAEFLQGRRPSLCPAREGRDSLRMVLACYDSAEQGRRIAFD
jgi:predicted dehydrogenase